MSTDDLYLNHEKLVNVAQVNQLNKLLSGRGQPGTHDIALGEKVLTSLAKINETKTPVDLPIFDKSLFKGEGDRRSDKFTPVSSPLDVFILEGWSMGFLPINDDEVKLMWEKADQKSPLKDHRLEDLLQINHNLIDYKERWYKYFSILLQVKTDDLQNIYAWRREQEHKMKASNGGIGMSDEQVKHFVDRYMPGYLLFLDKMNCDTYWKERLKTVLIDSDRKVINYSNL